MVSLIHDEYRSTQTRAAVTTACDAGTEVAFLGANAVCRTIRFLPSPPGADRHEVNDSDDTDPVGDPAQVTTQWRSPPSSDPENSLTGTLCTRSGAISSSSSPAAGCSPASTSPPASTPGVLAAPAAATPDQAQRIATAVTTTLLRAWVRAPGGGRRGALPGLSASRHVAAACVGTSRDGDGGMSAYAHTGGRLPRNAATPSRASGSWLEAAMTPSAWS